MDSLAVKGAKKLLDERKKILTRNQISIHFNAEKFVLSLESDSSKYGIKAFFSKNYKNDKHAEIKMLIHRMVEFYGEIKDRGDPSVIRWRVYTKYESASDNIISYINAVAYWGALSIIPERINTSIIDVK